MRSLCLQLSPVRTKLLYLRRAVRKWFFKEYTGTDTSVQSRIRWHIREAVLTRTHPVSREFADTYEQLQIHEHIRTVTNTRTHPSSCKCTNIFGQSGIRGHIRAITLPAYRIIDSCKQFLSYLFYLPSEKWSILKGKNLLPLGANSFF